MSVQQICILLGESHGSVALRESLWVYPIVETIHVLTLCLFVGFIALLDLRLINVLLRRAPVSMIAGKLLPWALVGFVLMTISGGALFYSNPARFYGDVFFRTKLVLLAGAGLNALVFHTGIYQHIAEWDTAAVTPARARLAGAISLTLWAAIVIVGRLIAYNWFR